MEIVKPLLVSYSDTKGGAARAAHRVHSALLKIDIPSRMLVASKGSDDWRIEAPTGKLSRGWTMAKGVIGSISMQLQQTPNQILHSASWIPSRFDRAINCSGADLVNLHWVCGELLSIEAIGRIRKPIVWTLHDMWPFCGAEHLSLDTSDARFRVGYEAENKPIENLGIDLDKWTWRRKRRSWRKKMHIIAPSEWLADCARESLLMKNWPIHVIPNPLDTDCFKPVDKRFCRSLLGLPQNCPLIMFGAIGGARDPNKGFDLLREALSELAGRGNHADAHCVVFGQGEPREAPNVGFPIHWMGHRSDDVSLVSLYNAVDLVVVPSKQEAFGQVASEAQACGTPVVAFNTTGLRDVVDHQKTGYLAKPFSASDLMRGIEWLLDDVGRRTSVSIAARERALENWSFKEVAAKTMDVYQSAIEK